MQKNKNFPNFAPLLKSRPQASADISGNGINGTVNFYQTSYGVMVCAQIFGLPDQEDFYSSRIFGFHIHQGTSCSGTPQDPFSSVLGHYDLYDCPHPYHQGDLLPLMSANGMAFSCFLTSRISVNEIIGKTVVIHSDPDDFTTQPAGNSGTKIACGEIKRTGVR